MSIIIDNLAITMMKKMIIISLQGFIIILIRKIESYRQGISRDNPIRQGRRNIILPKAAANTNMKISLEAEARNIMTDYFMYDLL